MSSRPLEITDVLWSVDAHGRRLPVRRSEAVGALRARGQRRAARLVGTLPASADVLDADGVDQLGLRVHAELQRLGEELQFPHRVADLVGPVLADLRPTADAPVRLVDVGCGLGHVVRALARSGVLGPDVELVGVDLNPVLVEEARRLAAVEGSRASVVHGDAFAPGVAVARPERTVVVSSGFLHHVEPDALADVFRAQADLGVAAFAHWDIAPCRWSTIGAVVFHLARMREPVSRHDGVLSARRSHPASVLLAAAAAGAPSYDVEVREGGRWHPRALDVLRPVVGIRRGAP